MSLTRHLKDNKSPLRKFLRDWFPNTRTFLANPRKQLREANTVRPNRDVPWSTIGMALDYRIRYYFAVTPHEELVAYTGARLLTDANVEVLSDGQLGYKWTDDVITAFDRKTGKRVGIYVPEHDGAVGLDQDVTDSQMTEFIEIGQKIARGNADIQLDDALPLASVYRSFFDQLDSITRVNLPVARRHHMAEEDELNRHCIVLALMEEVLRTGKLDGVLATDGIDDVESLLAIAQPHWLDDLRELSWKFYDRFHHLLPLPHVLNPTFDGSIDVGGADADMIVDGVLIDIKTTVRPEIRSEWVWQLLGYVLLDYSNHHHINSVGLYMARQGKLITWDLEETIRGLCAEDYARIGELRTCFKELVQRPSFQKR